MLQTKIMQTFDEAKQGYFGDHPDKLKAPGTLVTFQNVNGAWKENGDGIQDALDSLQNMGTNFVGMMEANINSQNPKTGHMRREIMKGFFSCINFSSNIEFDSENFYQPGGIMSLARGPTRASQKVTCDPTCNIQLVECQVGDLRLGI